MPARYAVGIDLGTTHTVVAAAPLGAGSEAEVFPVAQLVTPSEVARRALLPSMLYAPIAEERIDDPFADAPWVLGELARRRGTEVLGRLVASSKSWLVHPGVDRAAPILPWGGADDVPKLSPVDAAARILSHVARAWDADHEDAKLAEQDVVLTVPASFDEVARELSIEAARRAGLAPKLLEEPQAAFYDWMTRSPHDPQPAGERESLVLVVDVGGGTTDLSLMRASGAGRAREVTRVAVGPHVLLGGDNMDLALAHVCEPRLAPESGKLEGAVFAQLVLACRGAKELLLGGSPPEDAPVTVQSRGASLVGGSRTTRLSRVEVEDAILDGFLPAVSADARPQRTRSALVAFGLPYERDVAITRHIASFLRRHAPPGRWPDAVLFNGGVFRADRIAERVLDVLASWRGAPVTRLPDADPDVAVARGAVAYARARAGFGSRIGGGSGRGYFVGVAAEAARTQAVCIVPRGAEEGSIHAAGRTFALAVGRPARFELFASDEVDTRAGEVVEIDDERFARLPPIATTLEPIAGVAASDLSVAIEGELTPLGTVDLACVEAGVVAPRRFRLAFQLRGELAKPSSRAPAPASQRPLDPARALLDRAFGKPRADAGARDAKDLLRELERALGERPRWTTETNRAVFDDLIERARSRRRSPDHERVFWLLAGWCVRPGFGDPQDPRRVAALAPLFDERLAFPGEARGWQQFFIAWRRAAGGLDEAVQTKIRDFVDPHLAPVEAGRRPKKPILSPDDALDLASSLERVAAPRRSSLGGWVLERTWTDRDPRLWAAIGRLGARVPVYASVHHVVAPAIAERWLDHLLREKWDAVPTAATAAVALARRTGDRARDVGDRVRAEVIDRLRAVGVAAESIRAVSEVVPLEEKERVAFFGDALPLGLRLVS